MVRSPYIMALLALAHGLGKMGLVAVLVVGVSGCVSMFGQRVRDNSPQPPTTRKKTSTSDSPGSPGSPGSAAKEDSKDNPGNPPSPVTTESGKPGPASGNGPVQARKTGDSDEAGKGAPVRSLGVDEKLAPDHNPEDKVKAFDKYDHDKYARTLKAKAIQIVEKDAKVSYARLCTDTVEVSTLTTYRKQSSNTLAMTKYEWDPIDQTWHKTPSEKIRLRDWKVHLSVSASGKQCEVLKGTEEGVP